MFHPSGSRIFNAKGIPTAAIRASSNKLTQQSQPSEWVISAFASAGNISRMQTIASVSFACSAALGQNLIVLRKTPVRTTEGFSEHTASLVLNIESLLKTELSNPKAA
jgi:hypothetical protein